MATGNNSKYNKGSQSNTRSKTTASRSTSTARSPQKARSSQSSRQASASRTGGRKTKAQLAQEQARKNEIHLFICLAVCTFFFIPVCAATNTELPTRIMTPKIARQTKMLLRLFPGYFLFFPRKSLIIS